MTNIEIWKDVKDYEGLYQVSNLGKVKSLDRYLKNNNGYALKRGKMLNVIKRKDGYLQVTLSKNSIIKPFKIHRLVAEVFIDNPNKYICVNHKDENKENNILDNLEWCTYKYNNTYGTRLIRQVEKNNKEIYQYDKDMNLIKIWKSGRELKENGFSSSSISRCCNGKRKTSGGYIWSFLNIERGVA